MDIDIEFWAGALNYDDFEKFPKFIKLLSLLKDHISSEDTSCKLEKQLKETNTLLKAAKSNYLKIVTIYDIINKIEYQDDNKLNKSVKALNCKIEDIFVQKEVQQKLSCLQVKDIEPTTSAHGLLGISLSLETQPKTKLTDGELKCLQDIVNFQLEAYCREVAQLYDSLPKTDKGDKHQFRGDKLSTEQCQLFSSIIESKKQDLDSNEDKLKVAMQKQQLLILKYYKILNDAVQSIMDIGEICNSNNYSSKKAQMKILESDVLLLKMRSLKLQLMTEMYDVNIVRVHRRIKDHLDNSVAKLQSKKIITMRRLAVYESMGSQFHHLLNEYVDVTTKTERRAWILGALPPAVKFEKE